MVSQRLAPKSVMQSSEFVSAVELGPLDLIMGDDGMIGRGRGKMLRHGGTIGG